MEKAIHRIQNKVFTNTLPSDPNSTVAIRISFADIDIDKPYKEDPRPITIDNRTVVEYTYGGKRMNLKFRVQVAQYQSLSAEYEYSEEIGIKIKSTNIRINAGIFNSTNVEYSSAYVESPEIKVTFTHDDNTDLELKDYVETWAQRDDGFVLRIREKLQLEFLKFIVDPSSRPVQGPGKGLIASCLPCIVFIAASNFCCCF